MLWLYPEILQEIVVGDDHRCVVVEYRINIPEVPVVKIHAADFGVDAAPSIENPDGIGLVRLQGCRLVCDIVGNQRHFTEISPVFFNHSFQSRQFDRGLPGGICFAFQSFRTVDPLAGP